MLEIEASALGRKEVSGSACDLVGGWGGEKREMIHEQCFLLGKHQYTHVD